MQPDLREGTTSIEPGALVGKYRLTGHLGNGAMGVVFSAVHEALGREVAIKFLRREFTVSAELVMRFQREAELVSRIGHPNIVAVYDAGTTPDGSLYYVMERLQGEALAERLARAPLQDAEIGEVFGALASAVKAAHAIGVVHRDLKPGEVRIEARCGANDPQGPLRPAVPGKRQAAPQPLAVQFWLA
jgi:serine/threonine protein kinase